jgi:hypothetical protein
MLGTSGPFRDLQTPQFKVQAQKKATAEARRSAAQLRHLAMRLVVRLTIYHGSRTTRPSKAWNDAARSLVIVNSVAHESFAQPQTTSFENERLRSRPDEKVASNCILAAGQAPGKVHPSGTSCGEL